MKKLLFFLIVVLLTGCYEGVKMSRKPAVFKIVKIKTVETPRFKISKYKVDFTAGNVFSYVWFTDSVGKYEVGDTLIFVKK